jgi:glycosyltransferase involved in cell wall biosynthesis
MAPGTISVIIPTFNRTHFLEEAVESVLAQTRCAAEILIIDDGSDERFKLRLREIARKDPRITLHSLPRNSGVASARNKGLELALGDYLFFMDDDDLVPRSLFERAGAELDSNPATDGAICSYSLQFERPVGNERLSGPFIPGITGFDYRKDGAGLWSNPFNVFVRSCPPIHALLIRREAVANHRFPEDLIFGEDWYFWLSVTSRGCRLKLLADLEVCYRRHTDNATAKTDVATRGVPMFAKLEASGLLKSATHRFIFSARMFRSLICTWDRRAVNAFVDLMRSPQGICYFLALIIWSRVRGLVG